MLTQTQFLDSLACPRCKTKLKLTRKHCAVCDFGFSCKQGVWKLLYNPHPVSETSRRLYEKLHRRKFAVPTDGVYEVLACFARGNTTIDVASGDGELESRVSETVGVEFAYNALLKSKNRGAKFLVQADAAHLPFVDDAFDLAICAGSLEHFADPELAISEMARVSKIQILTVHKLPSFPAIQIVYNLLTHIISLQQQPIEQPLTWKRLENLLIQAQLKIIFKGVWTLPVNYGRVVKFLPELKNLPSCHFVITKK